MLDEGRVQHAIKTTKSGITVDVHALRREQKQNFPQWAQIYHTPLHDPNRRSSRVVYSS
jgi:hypothetical protein